MISLLGYHNSFHVAHKIHYKVRIVIINNYAVKTYSKINILSDFDNFVPENRIIIYRGTYKRKFKYYYELSKD